MTTTNSKALQDPIELLRAVNPIPDGVKDDFARQLDCEEDVRRLIARASYIGRDERRKGVLRLRVGLAAALAALLIVGTALGVKSTVSSFFESPPPDQKTKELIFSLAEGAPPGMDPGLLPANARFLGTVGDNGTGKQLWAAPTRSGGMCYGWVGSSGGCDRLGTTPLDAAIGYSPDRQSVREVSGFIHTRYADGMEIVFRDGKVVRPTLLKVSAPINAAFFVYDVPSVRQRPDQTVVAIRAVDAEGTVISEQGIPLSQLPPPDPIRDALVSKRQARIQIDTRDGEATLWTAPTRYDGRCAWAEVGGRPHFVAPCHPSGYPFDAFSIQPLATPTDVVLAGTVSERFADVIVRFADGTATRVVPTNGFLLYEVSADHLSPATRVTSIEALDPAGEVETSVRLGPAGSCWSSLPTNIAPRPENCPNAAELHGS